MVLALFLALILNNKFKGVGFFRSVFFLPHVISMSLMAVVLFNMFDVHGYINHVLKMFNIIKEPVEWFGGKFTSLTALVIGSVWHTFGINVIYFIAALNNVPEECYEAAKIDGASQHQIFIKIILPLAKPIIVYTMLMAFIAPWGDYMLVSYLAGTDPDKFNVAVGLRQWLSDKNIYEYYTRFCAGAVVISIPVTILFFILQKYYVEGITGGSVKG